MPLEPDHISRLVKTIGRRLSYSVDALPGEGLSGLLFRAASENGYPTVIDIARLIGMGAPTPILTPTAIANNLAMFDACKLTEILGSADRTSIQELIYTKSERGQKHIFFFGREIRWNKFFAANRRISPLSLRKSLHQKEVWSIRGLSFDPSTREKLLWRCPECDRPISSWYSYGVEVCGLCFKNGKKTDFRAFQQQRVEVDDEEALDFVIKLIDPEFPLARVRELPIPAPLIEFGPGPLFDLAIGLGRQLSKCDPASEQGFDAGIPATAIAQAGRALLGWPEKFAEFADIVLERHLERNFRGHQFDLRKLSELKTKNSQALRHPIRLVCQEEDTRLFKLISETAKCSREEQVFGSIAMILNNQLKQRPESRSLIEAGYSNQDGKSVRRRLLGAYSRLTLGQGETMSSYDASYFIASGSRKFRHAVLEVGIPLPFFLDLAETNLTEIVDEDAERVLVRAGTPPRQSLYNRLVAGARKGNPPTDVVELRSICMLMKRPINPWPALLRALLDKKISYWVSDSRATLIDNIWIKDARAAEYLLMTIRPTPHVFKVPVLCKDLAFYAGVSSTIIARLRASGLLKGSTLADFDALNAECILTREIQRRLSLRGVRTRAPRVVSELREAGVREEGRVVSTIIYNRKSAEAFYGSRLAQCIE
ncbi:hypothetical protein [Rhizobium leguminosarum]|uniref:hypothetical protein n=1 Tax=Rhizobium leguminosarum TaxID=384 RepID=UPI00102F46F3|nr:hypothetical protein [Rhizobium leguminosarum]TAY13988.1 hypothetical protein ELH96_20525 [Rhizobium leguminosarum]